ncbi:MAG: hypothetical protein JNK84_23070 [Phreatobacter sp.]|uniref:hypothetical protein n=1 Tax=Phreatobacter sp. TaxID=1966341 RepID=UPI001A420007|nr:hypothetical protein [Phreatobacter sp.]MBL8571967.1 hypothetical protein [Phreatobacter sp.]
MIRFFHHPACAGSELNEAATKRDSRAGRRTMGLCAGLAVAALTGGCDVFEPKIVSICEEALHSRLRSPAGYKRLKYAHYETPLTREQFEQKLAGASPSNRTMELWAFDNGKTKPMKIQVFLTYDAPNAYGTAVRGIVMCEHTNMNGILPRPDDVLLNGKTNFQWVMEGLRE